MHNFSPTSPVLGDPLPLLPAELRLRDVCIKVSHLSLALRVPHQGLSRNVAVWLSQAMAKPEISSIRSIVLLLSAMLQSGQYTK